MCSLAHYVLSQLPLQENVLSDHLPDLQHVPLSFPIQVSIAPPSPVSLNVGPCALDVPVLDSFSIYLAFLLGSHHLTEHY